MKRRRWAGASQGLRLARVGEIVLRGHFRQVRFGRIVTDPQPWSAAQGLDLVEVERGVACHDRETLDLRLGDEHAIERVAVMISEAPRSFRMPCPGHEDNRILECAAASGSVLIVSDDHDLISMSPWRGTPIVTSAEFVQRTDAMRRSRRR